MSLSTIKLLHIIPAISNSGGIEKYVYDLSINSPKDFDIKICTYYSNNTKSLSDFLSESGIEIYPMVKTWDEKVKYRLFSTCLRNILFPYIVKYFSLKKIINKIKPDLILAHGEDVELISSFLNFRCKINVIHSEKFFPMNPLYRFILAQRRKNSFIHSFIVFKRLNGTQTKSTVIKTGINFLEFSSAIKRNYYKKEKIVFGFLGRLSKEKGVKNLVIAFKKNQNENISNKLKIGGDGKELEKLKKYSASLLNKTIFFEGEIKNKTKFYERIDVLIIPSYTEGFPFVMLEAMASKVLVIANDVGGIRNLIKDLYNGILLDDNLPITITNAIRFVLENPAKVNYMVENAYKNVKEFSLEEFISQFYNSIKMVKTNGC